VLPLSVRAARQAEGRRDTVLLGSAPLSELLWVSPASLFRCICRCIYWEDVATDGLYPHRDVLDGYGKARKAMAACNGPDLNVGNAVCRQHSMFETERLFEHGSVAVESIAGGGEEFASHCGKDGQSVEHGWFG
jgi:hypothetical protein